MDIMCNFEKNIKLMLKELGITQSEFARKLEVGTSTVSDWLVKHKQPSFFNIYKICKVLNCTIEELAE